ncbi:MAG: NAD(P)H-hydrate dehydratase [Chloroflexi bacterium]|nr:NAD(P)H-hydrate dehydratase [Chloroflexota bacterium]
MTFAAAKRGHFASNLVGELIIADIGISDRLPALRDVTVEVATDVADLIPQRDPFGHKGTFGTVLVVAGSTHFTGAAALSGMAAYQSGAGLVRMAVPQPLHPILAGSLYEPVWLPLPHEAGAFAPASLGVLRDQAGGFDALLLGPGIGQSEPTAAFLRDLLAETELIEHAPLVIDADGLNLLAAQDAWWEQLPEHTVLTPHPGEMARLARLDTAVVQADRIGVAQRSAAKWGCVIVLKGAHTVVATPDGGAVIIPFASDALATAGSGDVLAGCIASLIAQGATPWDAAVAGAYVHAVAGSQVAEWIGSSRGVVAGDIPRALPRAFASVVE